LPDRYKDAIRATDTLISDPSGMDDDLRAALLGEFSPEQIVELLVTAAVASAFSKAAIAWGPPAPVPVTEVPTPTPEPADRTA
jgi:alkylhydroperoxidase family enzyme